MHAAALTAEALQNGFRRIVAVGGDGTLNEVVNGFFQAGTAVPPDACLALVPRGTGGDFRRTFGLNGSLRETCARLRGSGPSTSVASFTRANGSPRTVLRQRRQLRCQRAGGPRSRPISKSSAGRSAFRRQRPDAPRLARPTVRIR